jgi:hypothetical protein
VLLFRQNQRNDVDRDWTDEIITTPKWAEFTGHLLFSLLLKSLQMFSIFLHERTQKFYWNMEERIHLLAHSAQLHAILNFQPGPDKILSANGCPQHMQPSLSHSGRLPP